MMNTADFMAIFIKIAAHLPEYKTMHLRCLKKMVQDELDKRPKSPYPLTKAEQKMDHADTIRSIVDRMGCTLLEAYNSIQVDKAMLEAREASNAF